MPAHTKTERTYRFSEFAFYEESGRLYRGLVQVKLQPQPAKVLAHLVQRAPAIVSREELGKAVWSHVNVDLELSLNYCIRQIRSALGDSAAQPRFLETLPKLGYRFIAPFECSAEPHADTAPEAAVLKTPDKAHPSSSQAVKPRWQAISPRGQVLLAVTVLVACLTIITFMAGARKVARPVAGLPIDPVAIDAYQHGRFLWFSNHQEASGAYFLRATQIAPTYAPAWAGLANYYGAQMVNGKLDPRQTLPLQDAAAHRAGQLDGSLPETHIALGATFWEVGWDYPAALRELDRAIEIDPKSSEAHHLRWKLLAQLNRPEEALVEQRLSMQLNPLERPWELANALLLSRRYDAAITEARLRLEGSSASRTWLSLSRAYAGKGMQEESEKAHEQALILSGNHALAASIHRAFQHGGQRAVMLSLLADLKAQSRDHYVSPYRFATLYANLHGREQVFDALEEAVHQHSPLILDIQNDFIFDELHSDPRYRAIIQRIGLPRAW